MFCVFSKYTSCRRVAGRSKSSLSIHHQGYCWLENVRGHFVENTQLESLSPSSLHYKTNPLFQNEWAILKIKGQFCPWPLLKLSLHHPPEIIFCDFYKYTSCCRQLNQPQAGWCLYCPYTIFQKLCFVSFLNTPSATRRPVYLRALLYSMSIIQRNQPSVFLQD